MSTENVPLLTRELAERTTVIQVYDGNGLSVLTVAARAALNAIQDGRAVVIDAQELAALRARVAELEAEQEKLIADIQTYVGITAEQNAENQALQARIDELMWEFCPNEMTPEQLAEWGKHQVPSTRDAGPSAFQGRTTRREE